MSVDDHHTMLHVRATLIRLVAALLAKYKGPAMEKPVVRPYTPTSDGGE